MKALLPVILLATLVSCGEKAESKKPDYGMFASKLEEAERAALKPGVVRLTKESGNTLGVNDYTGRMIHTAVKKSMKEIVLKVDGDNYYTYVESTEGDYNHLKKRVEIHSFSQQTLAQLLKEKGAQVSDDSVNLRASYSERIDKEGEYGAVYGLFTVDLSINQGNLCEGYLRQTFSELRGHREGEWYNLPNAVEDNIMTCGKRLTNNELKAIKLDIIQVCDERTDEYREWEKCKDNQDMRHLTADLVGEDPVEVLGE